MSRSIYCSATSGLLGNNRSQTIKANTGGELAVNTPKTIYGEGLTAELNPELNGTFVYGLHPNLHSENSIGSGSYSSENSMIVVNSGAAANSSQNIRSKRALRYIAGMGTMGRFSAVFESGSGDNVQVIGFGSAECGFFYAMVAPNTFAILHNKSNLRETRRLTITTGSSTAENVAVVLDGATFNVPVTNTADTEKTAWEIANHNYSSVLNGWAAEANDNYVTFVSINAGSRSGSYSLTGTTAVGSFSSLVVGTSGNTDYYLQSSWNVDVMNGSNSSSNPSGMLLDPTKGNVYQIAIQYLGFGKICFSIEDSNGVIVPVHEIQYANNNTVPSLAYPTLPFSMTSINYTNTTNVALRCASYAGFNQGIIPDSDILYSSLYSRTGITTTLRPYISIRNDIYFNGHANNGHAKLLKVAVSNDDKSNLEVYIYRDVTMTNNAIFSEHESTNSIVSICKHDITTDTFSGGTLLFSYGVVKRSNDVAKLTNKFIAPGDTITIAVNTTTTTTDATISLQWEEYR